MEELKKRIQSLLLITDPVILCDYFEYGNVYNVFCLLYFASAVQMLNNGFINFQYDYYAKYNILSREHHEIYRNMKVFVNNIDRDVSVIKSHLLKN